MSAPTSDPQLLAIASLKDNYIWLLVDKSAYATVIDPGESAPVEKVLEDQHLTLANILLTHHHHDHTGGVDKLLQAHPDARVFAPEDERITCPSTLVHDSESFNLAHLGSVQVIAVPGHTISHVAYVIGDLLFCGDALFSLGCGRVFEGTMEQMLTSLDKLASLPDNTRVCCAHEYTLANGRFAQFVDADNPDLAAKMDWVKQQRAHNRPSLPSLMGDEKRCNPFLRPDSKAIKQWSGYTDSGEQARLARFSALREAKDSF